MAGDIRIAKQIVSAVQFVTNPDNTISVISQHPLVFSKDVNIPNIISNNISSQNVQVVNNFTVKTKEVIIKGISTDSGTVIFNNSKKVKVYYNTTWTTIPRLTFTFVDYANANNLAILESETTLTYFTIIFTNNWTGKVNWNATER